MIEVKNLVKRFGGKAAVNDISFTVHDGEVLGFLGPNGAGKTTTMNMLTGYLSSTSGSITISGYDILAQPELAKSKIGYLPEKPPLYPDMTVEEYLDFIYELKGCTLKRYDHIKEICELVGIEHVYGRVIKHLSKGYQQRVGLAQALVGNPEVLILDEPTVGLDPRQIIEIRNLIRRLGEKHTVIFSTHILSEVQAVCERILVINDGKIVADDTPDSLSVKLYGDNRLTVRVAGPADGVYRAMRALDGVKKCELLGIKEKGSVDINVESAAGADMRIPIFKVCAENGWPLLGIKNTELDLEDIFMKLTGPEEDIPAQAQKKVRRLKSRGSASGGTLDDVSEGTKAAKRAAKAERAKKKK